MTAATERAQIIRHPALDQGGSLTSYAANLADIKQQVNLIQQVMRDVMKEGEHYGVIPGCGEKPALLKPGAEKLMLTFRLSNTLDVKVVDLLGGHREYQVIVTIYSPTGQRLGTGVGSCTTMESKYRFRVNAVPTDQPVPSAYWEHREKNKKRAQDIIGKGNIVMKNDEGVWVIAKKGERVEYDNPADYYNTCLKMAKKRGLVDGILTSTAASDIFTQDIEEDPELYPHYRSEGKNAPPAGGTTGKGGQGSVEGTVLINQQQLQTIEKLLEETKTDRANLLQFFHIESLANLPASSFQVAIKKLKATPSGGQKPQSTSGGTQPPVDTKTDQNGKLTETLKARSIPFEVKNGQILAKPKFTDAGAREFLKQQGFKWDNEKKAWKHAA